MKNQTDKPRSRSRCLITIQPRQKYATIDVDTWRDGYFSFPKEAIQQMRALAKSYGFTIPYSNPRGFWIRDVPIEIVADLAQRIAEIAAHHRNCSEHAEWKTLTGDRAPLVAWIDRYGRLIEPPM
jgi:hypothetical protein